MSVCRGEGRGWWCLIWALEDRKGFRKWEKKENATFYLGESDQSCGLGVCCSFPCALLVMMPLEMALATKVRRYWAHTLVLPLSSCMSFC